MMIHPRDASIADAAMMGVFRLVGLADAAHGVELDAFGDKRDGSARNSSGIRQHGFGVTGPNK
eukprot:scaffold13165_cov177-Amphora_coffeaeformis.AAC.8